MNALNDIDQIKYLADTHSSNPYHNFKHCESVYGWCEAILAAEKLTPSNSLKWAALFHDYEHSGGNLDDDANIKIAVFGLQYMHKKRMSKVVADMTINEIYNAGYDVSEACNIIKCTKYVNGIFPIEPVTIEQRAIRDADLMSIFLPDVEAANASYGLYNEMLIKFPDLTPDAFWERNVDFLSTRKWYTTYATELATTLHTQLDVVKPLFMGNFNG